MELHIAVDRKREVDERRLQVDKDTLRDLELRVQGYTQDRPIGCLTLDQHRDILQLQRIQAYNTAVDHANLQDEFQQVGVVPFFDEEDGEFYVAAANLPNDYYFEIVDRRTCGIKTMKNVTIILCVLLILNSFCSTTFWCIVEYAYPIEFMRKIMKKHEGAFRHFCLKFGVGISTALLSLWSGSIGLLSILCPRPNLMKSAFTHAMLLMIPGTIQEILEEEMGTYNESVYWPVTRDDGKAWDSLQYSLKCCGIDDWTDWSNKSAWGDLESRKAKMENRGARLYPESCCIHFNLEVNNQRLERNMDYAFEMLFCQVHSSKQVHYFRGCLRPGLRFFSNFGAAILCFMMIHNFLTLLASIAVGKLYVERRRQSQPEYAYSFGSWVMDFLIVGFFRDFYQDPVMLKRYSFADNPFHEPTIHRFRPAQYDQRDREGYHDREDDSKSKDGSDDGFDVLFRPPPGRGEKLGNDESDVQYWGGSDSSN